MTRLFALHSAYGLATAVAAIDEGLLDDDRADRGDLLLVPFVSARVPEIVTGIAADPALETLRARFGRVEDLDALLGPLHPSGWDPAPADLPMLERLLTRAWSLDPDDLELFVQSPQVAPARTLMALFPRARITIIGDGLMTYAPMRVALGHATATRVVRVVHADVVPGVVPLVGAPAASSVAVPAEALGRALAETDPTGAGAGVPRVGEGPVPVVAVDGRRLDDGASTVIVLGQYLSALGLVSEREEIALQRRLVDRAAKWAPERIVFRPHPAAPPLQTDAVRERALSHGVEFAVHRGAPGAENLAERLGARAVVAAFSTALPTVRALHGTEIGSAGAKLLLQRLVPYENSNRIPLVIVDALTRADSPYADPARLQHLIDAVGYAMQPEIAGHLRGRAVDLLRTLPQAERDRYFDPARLRDLRLPGAMREAAWRRAFRSAGGTGRLEELRLTAMGARRRAGRAWRVIRGR